VRRRREAGFQLEQDAGSPERLSMRFVGRLRFADPHVAARKLVEIAIALGWVWRHESGTYVKFTDAGAALLA
jgi:hypothetical protein